MKNKRGLSAVVATLIIILLVLVAVGILWAVISNVIEGGAEDIALTERCRAIDFRTTTVTPVENQTGNYSVRFERTSTGEEIQGIKVILRNETQGSGMIDFGESFGPVDDETRIIDSSQGTNEQTIVGANEMVYVPFFEDDAGNELLCPERVYEFVA